MSNRKQRIKKHKRSTRNKGNNTNSSNMASEKRPYSKTKLGNTSDSSRKEVNIAPRLKENGNHRRMSKKKKPESFSQIKGQWTGSKA